MYLPRSFAEDDPERIAGALRAYPLAQLVTFGEGGLTATPLPLLFVPEDGPQGSLLGHLARANPQWKTADAAVEALAIFSGPDGYVTPSWYATKRETGKVVPTWNYVSIQIRGRISFTEEPDRLLAIVTRLTEVHERPRAAPWAVSDAPADFVAAQLRAIVGLRLEITQIAAKWKMSQNRPEADRAGVRDGLTQEGTAAAEALRAMMPDD